MRIAVLKTGSSVKRPTIHSVGYLLTTRYWECHGRGLAGKGHCGENTVLSITILQYYSVSSIAFATAKYWQSIAIPKVVQRNYSLLNSSSRARHQLGRTHSNTRSYGFTAVLAVHTAERSPAATLRVAAMAAADPLLAEGLK